MTQTVTFLTPEDLSQINATVSSLSNAVSALETTVNSLASRVASLEASKSTSISAPVIGASATGNSHDEFKNFMTKLGGWDANSLHYTFQPSFKADFTTWSASGCTDHSVLASTKWATPTANNFKTLVSSIPQDGRTHRIVMYQEPEDNMAPADFHKVVKYMYDAVQESGRKDILIVLNLQVYWNSEKGGSSAYIFDANNGNKVYADVVGWSFWPHPSTGKAKDMQELNAAIGLTDSSGAQFAISSFIMTGTEDATYLADIVNSVRDLVVTRYNQGKHTDHVVVYWDGTNAPGVNSTVQAATKAMFNAFRGL